MLAGELRAINARLDVLDLGAAAFLHGLLELCCKREAVTWLQVLPALVKWTWVGVMNFDLGSGQMDRISSQGS